MKRLFLLFALLSLSAQAYTLPDNEPYPERKAKKFARASRTATAPVIDGLLDEAWLQADILDDFQQFKPVEDAEASFRTEVRFLYDDEALYVFFRGYDDFPDEIIANTGRRDDDHKSDAFFLSLDSHHDHQSSYVLGVTAAGVQLDLTVSHDEAFDPSWDGVWDSSALIDEEGWTAEMRLPFTLFRFTEKQEMIWGLHLKRDIPRLHEEILWMNLYRGEPGNVSRAGHLVGLDGIHSPRAFEILPYLAAGLSTEPGEENETELRGGVNLKWGLSPAVTLDATVNPDFGQVEADPAVLNLSAYETFFPEKRPFFVEGKDIFAFNEHLNAFHSRRIGREPGFLGEEHFEDGDRELSRPQNTTILGAAKLTGKSEQGMVFGALSAVTAREYALVEDAEGNEQSRLIEPLSHYFVGNIAKEFSEGRSKTRLLLTHAGRQEADDAAGFGFGSSWRSEDGFSSLGISLVGSAVEDGGNLDRGMGGNAWAVSGNRNLNLGLWTHHTGPGLELNDLGYLRRTSVRGLGIWLTGLFHEPWSYFRSGRSNLEFEYFSNWDGLKLGKKLGLSSHLEFLNYWNLSLDLSHSDAGYDDMETRDGPVTWSPGGRSLSFSLHSDRRKVLTYLLGHSRSQNHEGGGGTSLSLGSSMQAGDKIRVHLSGSWSRTLDKSQWIGNIEADDPDLGEFVQATGSLFAELESRILDFNLRANYSFNEHLTMETWLQPFLAWGDYGQHRELEKEFCGDFLDWSGDDLAGDFLMKSFNLNAVLRWQYRPGSTLYLVWSRSHFLWDEWDGDFKPMEALRDDLLLKPENRFMLKLNTWIG